ncbi:MAG TPA: hypothetical protein VN429_00645 [Methanospirillum sp.]|uniref:hypothetical protein n=1 Tax=Methanospirillum sp. TaxID=45200 RepID=UPI002BD6640A|nr:hypothetical protein [Methanospirillum sp.]HWQ62891.1 hypothetical protein [Methanospirillum sp.]
MRSSTSNYWTRRTAEYSARDFLVDHGYAVLRVAESHTHEPVGINLIAWNKDGKTLFICARSIRRGSIKSDVEALSKLVRLSRYPGSVEYWVRHKAGWRRYLVDAGGAIPLPVLL